MSFKEKIPDYHNSLKVKLTQTQNEIYSLWGKIDDEEDEEAREHEMCDCSYCPYADYTPKRPLTQVEREDIEAQIEELENVKQELLKTIRSLEGYAKLIGADQNLQKWDAKP